MLKVLLELVYNPLFWAVLSTIVITGINVLLYRINRRTFKILYEKPTFKVKAINVLPYTEGGTAEHIFRSFITLDVFNPSSFNNRICSYRLTRTFWGTLIAQGEVDLSIPKSSKKFLEIKLNYNAVEKYTDKSVKLTLTDLKNSKTQNSFRLKSDPISARKYAS